MCLTEYDEKEAMELFREEGRKEDRASRDWEKISEMLRKGKTPEAIVKFCDYSMELIMDVQRSLLAAG